MLGFVVISVKLIIGGVISYILPSIVKSNISKSDHLQIACMGLFSTSIFSEIIPTKVDKEGRFLIPEKLKLYSNISSEVTFVGQGHYFQIWEPAAAIQRQVKSRERLLKEKRTLASILIENKTND